MSQEEVGKLSRRADQAYREYDYDGALALYKRALGLLEGQPSSYQRDKSHADILLRIVDALSAGGKWLDALMYVDTIVNIARTSRDSRLEIEANLRAGQVLTKRSMWREARKRFNETLETAKTKGTKYSAAECHYGLAYLNWRTGDMEGARKNVETALSIVEAGEDPNNLRGRALILLATIWNNIGKTQLSIAEFKRAIDVSKGAGDMRELARAHNNLGEVYKRIGDYETARQEYERCVDVARRSRNLHTEIYGLTNAAECLARVGNVQDAESSIGAAEDILRGVEDPYASAYTHYVRALIADKRGDVGSMRREFELTISTLRSLKATYDLGVVHYEYATALRDHDEVDEALRMYKKAKESLEKAEAGDYLDKTERAIVDCQQRSDTS